MIAFKSMKKKDEYRHHYQPHTVVNFPLIDRERLKIDLAVVRVGREDGLREIPATNAISYSSKENEIIAKIEDELKKLRDECNTEMQAYQARMTESYNFQSKINQIKQIANEVLTRIKYGTNIFRDHMNECSGVLVKAEEALRTFQRQHRREGPPHTKSTVLSIAILAVLFFVEVGINSSFFATGSELGLLGGLISAFVLGFFNTGMAFFLGLGARNINRIEWYYKIFGVLCIIIYIFISLNINFLAGHYRDISENIKIEDPSSQLMSQLGWQIISFQGITSFNSLILIAAGIIFSIICFMDGLFLYIDAYPGYSKTYKRREDAAQEFIVTKHEAYQQTEELSQSATSQINQVLAEIEKSRVYYQQVIMSRNNWINSFVEHQNYLEKIANDLLVAYRQENQQTRKTSPPNYFNESWQLQRLPIPENLNEMISNDELKSYISQATQAADQYNQQINAAYHDALKEFKCIEDLTPF